MAWRLTFSDYLTPCYSVQVIPFVTPVHTNDNSDTNVANSVTFFAGALESSLPPSTKCFQDTEFCQGQGKFPAVVCMYRRPPKS